MAKIFRLKKSSDSLGTKRIGYKIDYESVLNAAQYEAVMHNNGPALVIAGAGTGKTRTLIYRVARLIEDGIRPEAILLLTFTRKAASEMARRAAALLDGRCERVSGGTFHSFAMMILRKYAKSIGYEPSFTIIDRTDAEDTINLIRNSLKINKSKKRFPKKGTLNNIFSLSINRCDSVKETVEKEYPHFSDEIDSIEQIFGGYKEYKLKYNIMDYDDLLVNLLRILKENEKALLEINSKYKYIMVDEYQDTNRLQHELVLLLAGSRQNVIAVGDDAQSIYSFRGANFQNIMFFPESFDNCKIYKIEENYRSTQPILTVTNEIIDAAIYKYEKRLFTRRTDGETPILVSAANERQQSEFISQHVLKLREEDVQLSDIAILFRSGFHSFDLEIELNKLNIPYKKFGGIKFIETAHIKDLIAYMRILYNPRDSVSWQRALLLLDGVGPRTAFGIINMITDSDITINSHNKLSGKARGGDSIKELFAALSDINHRKYSVADKATHFAEYYKPLLKRKYDDWQKRWRDIDMFLSIAERYTSMASFLSDMALEPPVEAVAELEAESKEDEFLTLSTIHSAKGLEWQAVFLIWALEGKFPSAKSVESVDSVEEERRLFYVACTRAKDQLFITYPTNIYDRETGYVLSEVSRFVQGLDDEMLVRYVLVEDEE